MNIIRIIDRYDHILDEFDTEFEYEKIFGYDAKYRNWDRKML